MSGPFHHINKSPIHLERQSLKVRGGSQAIVDGKREWNLLVLIALKSIPSLITMK
jgi:hypothetical protein